MKKAQIYILIDPRDNSPRYIGRTLQSLRERLGRHLNDKAVNKRTNWIKHLKNLGLIPTIELLEECDEANYVFLEKYWISQFKCWGFTLVNDTDGGVGCLGKKMKPGHCKGNKNPFYNKKHSEESKAKMSEFRKSFVESEETKKKKSKSHKEMNFKPSKFMINRMIEVHGRKVIQLDMNNNFIQEFHTIKEAADILKCQASKITLVCQGKRKSHAGWKFQYST